MSQRDDDAALLAGAIIEIIALRAERDRLKEEVDVLEHRVGAATSGYCYQVGCAECVLNDHDMTEEAEKLNAIAGEVKP